MKKIINKKTYNTETAKKIGHITFGEFGDTHGYEEKLYQTKAGLYFIHGIGGTESKYTTETITPLTETEAKAWRKENK